MYICKNIEPEWSGTDGDVGLLPSHGHHLLLQADVQRRHGQCQAGAIGDQLYTGVKFKPSER